ncbi:MAG: hypothetical protein ACREQM_05360 [Candidatus Dormibacteraceae bacterium]
MGLRRTIVAVGIGAALAYFLDPVSGAERRGRVQKTIEDQLNRRTGLSTGGTVETSPGTESTEL